ncbi:hypothetical protein D3C72_1124480 [compost metagenome]
MLCSKQILKLLRTKLIEAYAELLFILTKWCQVFFVKSIFSELSFENVLQKNILLLLLSANISSGVWTGNSKC